MTITEGDIGDFEGAVAFLTSHNNSVDYSILTTLSSDVKHISQVLFALVDVDKNLSPCPLPLRREGGEKREGAKPPL